MPKNLQNIKSSPHLKDAANYVNQSARRRVLRWLPWVATFALTACAGLGSGSPENAVRGRATERWKALIDGDFTRAHGYSTAGFRAVVTADSFRTRFGSSVKWVGSEVVNVTCAEPTKCIAVIRLEYKPLMGGRSSGNMTNLDTHFEETWLLEEGQWWIFQSLKG